MIITSYSGKKYFYNVRENTVGATGNGKFLPITGFQQVILPFDTQTLHHSAGNHAANMILEITNDCNMNCAYCHWGGNSFINKKSQVMSYKTAKEAVDWLLEHSSKSKQLSVSFFGGEPLLHFDLVRKVYNYSTEVFGDRCIYEISTNGTLLSDKIIKWLADHKNISLNISLNGPPEIHDRLRPYRDGRTSHSDIIKNLASLQNAFADSFHERVHIQANYANFQEKKILQAWLDVHQEFSVTLYPISIKPTQENYCKINEYYTDQATNTLLELSRRSFVAKLLKPVPLPTLLEAPNSLLLKIHHRKFPDPANAIYFSGVCTPLVTRFYVDTAGNIKICERKHDSMILGNVFNGINWNLLNRTINQLNTLFEESLKCRNCVACRFCCLCFVTLLQNHEVATSQQMLPVCEAMRNHFLSELRFYVSITERVPCFFDKLDQ